MLRAFDRNLLLCQSFVRVQFCSACIGNFNCALHCFCTSNKKTKIRHPTFYPKYTYIPKGFCNYRYLLSNLTQCAVRADSVLTIKCVLFVQMYFLYFFFYIAQTILGHCFPYNTMVLYLNY